MTTDGTPLNSAEMFGTAKKINNDLEQLPLHTHGALVNLLTTAFQHRQVGMQREDALQKQRQQEQMLALQERQMALAEKRQQEADARCVLEMPAPSAAN